MKFHPHERQKQLSPHFFVLCGILCTVVPVCTQTARNSPHTLSHQVVPISEYVTITPYMGSDDPHAPLSLNRSDFEELEVVLDRDQIPKDSGPQFIRIITHVFNRDGSLFDKITQFALTFPRGATPEEDDTVLARIVDAVSFYGFISRRKIDTVTVEFDSIPDWAVIKIEVRPDEDFTKYTSRIETKQEFYYRAKGPRFESAFYLGIPKVLYDSNQKDTMNYGNASTMLRFYFLDAETGARFPLNLGIGTFGISTPIDVSENGGGFAVSLLFDVVEIVRKMNIDISSKFNAGIELTPFFPIAREARVLLNARIGYAP